MSEQNEVRVPLDPMKVVLNPARNQRWGKESKDAVKDFAGKLMQEGQLQDILFDWVDEKEGTWTPKVGNRRAAAGKYIVESGLNKKFKLMGIHRPDLSDDRKAFTANIAENEDRKDLTIMDRALICFRATSPEKDGGMGMTQRELSELTGWSEGSIRNYVKFYTKLDKDVQARAHRGELSYDYLVSLTKAEGDEQKQKVEALDKKRAEKAAATGKDAKDVKLSTKEQNEALASVPAKSAAAPDKGKGKDSTPAPGPQKVAKAMRAAEIKTDLATLDAPGTGNSVRNLVRALHCWMDGEASFKQLQKAFEANCAGDDEVELSNKHVTSYMRAANDLEKARRDKEKAQKEREEAAAREKANKEKAKKQAAQVKKAAA